MNVLFVCTANSGRSLGKRYLNWQLPDPKHEPLERVREMRDDIAGRIHDLVRELDAEKSGAR